MLKQIPIRVNSLLHKELRMAVIKNNTSINKIVNEFLAGYARKNKEKEKEENKNGKTKS